MSRCKCFVVVECGGPGGVAAARRSAALSSGRGAGGAGRALGGARGAAEGRHAAVCSEPPGARHGWRAAARAASGGAGRAQRHRRARHRLLAPNGRGKDPALPRRLVQRGAAPLGCGTPARRRHGVHVRGARYRVR